MFDNLIESKSHKDEIARKSWYFLFTALGITLTIVVAAIVSIQAVEASLGSMDLELTTLVAPVPVPEAPEVPKGPERPPDRQPAKADAPNVDVRERLVANIEMPQLVPDKVSAKASDVPPVRDGITTILGPGNRNAESAAVPGPGGPGGSGTVVPTTTRVVVADEPPPPASTPTPTPIPKVVSKGVITGLATSLPKPAYPNIARAAHASGTVTVAITIDENGKVVSAKAVSGHPLLQAAAVGAAYQAKFSPTKLSGQPVKVTGTIAYNFVYQ